jgi:uncharacterized membrane protein YgcG
MGRKWGMGLGLVLSSALAFGQPSTEVTPGTVNYVEGQASLNGQELTQQSVRNTRLHSGQELDTQRGNVELLLTPGVFLRLGNDSSLRMVSPGLANTEVDLLHGSAMLEVDQLYKQNNLDVVVDGATAHIQKRGLYEFNANPPAAMVFEGQAKVLTGEREVKVKGGHELLLAEAGKLKPREFDKTAAEQDALYRWSRLRSEYESEANTEMARTIYLYGGWYGPGWYWDPYWSAYAWMPGYGPFYGPFGYPFIGPGYGLGIGFGFGGVYGYPRFYGHGERFEHGYRGGFHEGGFHGGELHEGGGFHAGGFRGGGGFHGGGGRRG